MAECIYHNTFHHSSSLSTVVSGEAWVLKKFQIDPSGLSGAYLYIEARQPGFTAFMLNIMGLDPNASVKVTRGAISMRQSSLMGMDQVTTALSSVGAFIGGYRKPISYLFMATVFLIGGLIGDAMADSGGIFAIIGIVLALTMFLLYVFNKQMYIGFETSGGTVHALIFKKAIIEGVPVDIGLIEDAILMVNGLISSSGVGGGAVMERHVIGAAPQMVSVPITTGPDDTPSEGADAPEDLKDLLADVHIAQREKKRAKWKKAVDELDDLLDD